MVMQSANIDEAMALQAIAAAAQMVLQQVGGDAPQPAVHRAGGVEFVELAISDEEHFLRQVLSLVRIIHPGGQERAHRALVFEHQRLKGVNLARAHTADDVVQLLRSHESYPRFLYMVVQEHII